MKILKAIFAGLLLVCALPVHAGFDEGMVAYQKHNYAATLKEWRPLAEQGNADAQAGIGMMYFYGVGVKTDYVKAMQWYRKAAEQGQADATFSIGLMYFNGDGVKTDYAKAMQWYRKAAELRSSWAMVSIGSMYSDGSLGVAKDYAEALRWYSKALEQGNAKDKFDMARGVALAQFSIGSMYEHGEGVRQDYAEALRWYIHAAEQGLDFAQEYVGMMYDLPIGVQQNYAEALKWYRKAAEQGNVSAKKRILEIEKAKLNTAASKTDSRSIISSDIPSEDGGSKIHLGYEIGGTEIVNVALSLPEGFLFCDPRGLGRIHSAEYVDDCLSTIVWQHANTDTMDTTVIVLPAGQHTVLMPPVAMKMFTKVVWVYGDKFYFIVYNKYGDKFSVEFFKRNLVNNYSVY